MIDGLGIAGYEGVFLKVCEITLSVLRTHKEALMTVLETFIHDPLVEWTKSHKSSGVEVRNPHAQVLSILLQSTVCIINLAEYLIDINCIALLMCLVLLGSEGYL